MIISEATYVVSPIALSVVLIIFLMILELGNGKMKKLLIPIIVALLLTFSVVLVRDVMAKW